MVRIKKNCSRTHQIEWKAIRLQVHFKHTLLTPGPWYISKHKIIIFFESTPTHTVVLAVTFCCCVARHLCCHFIAIYTYLLLIEPTSRSINNKWRLVKSNRFVRATSKLFLLSTNLIKSTHLLITANPPSLRTYTHTHTVFSVFDINSVAMVGWYTRFLLLLLFCRKEVYSICGMYIW